MTVSAKASASLQWLFERALRENLDSDGAGCDIHVVPELAGLGAAEPGQAPRHLVVIGISSYLFRLVVLFDFDTAPDTLAYLARRAGGDQAALQGGALADAYGELVNMICGATKRYLHDDFPHTGLSTPVLLDSSCARYVGALRPSHSLAYDVRTEAGMRFRMAVCVCVSAGATLDFAVERRESSESAAAAAGEIEFF